MADVIASISFVSAKLRISDKEIIDRAQKKLELYIYWDNEGKL